MKRICTLLLICVWAFMLNAQGIAGYEYWIDSYFDSRKAISTSSGEISLELDVSDLTRGIHYFNFRAQGNNGLWSSPFSYYFFRSEASRTGNKLSKYEYWLDTYFDTRQQKEFADGVAMLNLDVSTTTPGIHYFNFRAQDTFGMWSSPVTYYFLRATAERIGDNKPTNYEYWLDNNYDARQSNVMPENGILPLELDVSALTGGVHYFNFRAQDAFGGWSSPVTHYFLRATAERIGDNKPTNYEYWLDNNYDARQSNVMPENGILPLELDVSALTGGVHYFNFRAQDAFGVWSSPVTHYFYRMIHRIPTRNLITHYRYVFNNDENTSTTVELTPPVNPLEWNGELISIPEMRLELLPDSFGILLGETPGEVTLKIPTEASFMIQFKDSTETWSQPVVSRFEHEIQKKTALHTTEINQSVTVEKPLKSEALAYRIDITKEESVYWKADQPCQVLLFGPSGKWKGKISAAELLEGYDMTSPEKGTYYAVLHSAIQDETYNKENISFICIGRTASDTIQVDIPGTLPQLVGDPSSLHNLTLTGYLNGTDIKFIRSLPLLEKLDIQGAHIVEGGDMYYKEYRTANEVTGDEMFTGLSRLNRLVLSETCIEIGPSALKGCSSLQELMVPSAVATVGEGAFSGCNNLLVVRWNSPALISSEAFDTPANMGNCLIYAPAGASCTYAGNVVMGGMAEQITLTHAKPFRCPVAFKAKSIAYTRNFSMTSGKGIAAGWETITLPFTVHTFSHAQKGELAPFNSGNEQAKPFWLRSLAPDRFEDVTSLEANTPYIISMPNSDAYEEEFNIRGDVSFRAESTEGVEVKTTVPASLNRPVGQKFTMVPAYSEIQKHDTVYAINLAVYEDIAIGGAFVRNLRALSPFEAYAISNVSPAQSPKFYSIGAIGDLTGMDHILLKQTGKSFKAYTVGNLLYIESDKAQMLSIYATDGKVVRMVEVGEGKNKVTGLEEGIYFLEKTKIVIGK